jgi:hypothetical protein
LPLRKTVLVSHIRFKNEISLAPDAVNENEFLLSKQYLSMKGVFLVENHILDNVGMFLPSAQQTAQTQVRTCTVVFGRQAVDYKNGWIEKKRNKIFFLFCFSDETPFNSGCTNVTLPTIQR